METSHPTAWSNGQWITLDLAKNRYFGGEVRADAVRQAVHAASVASLRTPANKDRALIPKQATVAHYLRCAWIAHRVRHLSIRDQLDMLRSAPRSRTQYVGNVDHITWLYQHIRNFRFRRPMCVEDSVCCALFLGQYIETLSFHIGVVQPPFQAHAWVQVGNVIANDTKGVVEAYSEILRLDL